MPAGTVVPSASSRNDSSPSGRLSGKGDPGRPEDPAKIGESRVNSVRVPVRFIELEQQAAIRHNSIISFFRAFFPSSLCYDGTRRPRDTQAPHVYQSGGGQGFTPASSLKRGVSLFLSLSSRTSYPSHPDEIENSKSQIPNISRAEREYTRAEYFSGGCDWKGRY